MQKERKLKALTERIPARACRYAPGTQAWDWWTSNRLQGSGGTCDPQVGNETKFLVMSPQDEARIQAFVYNLL